jgi:deoxyribose-phosphate aldolase
LNNLDKEKLALKIEHTLLGNNVNDAMVISHVNEALALKVYGVCLPLAFVPLAKKLLKDSSQKVITVVDFPLGENSTEKKAHEALAARELGTDEIDMVLDYKSLINKNYTKALNDIKAVVKHAYPVPIKVIVETSALNKNQLAISIALVALGGAQFIKTSTGFHTGGAKVEDIIQMRELLPKEILIKASGGIRDYSSALAMIKAGASRIGSSKSKEILKGTSCT